MLEEILTNDNVVDSIRSNLGYILKIIPELGDTIGFEHKHPHHHLDVFEHTLYALSLSENDYEIRLALLLHDIGKPHSFTEGEVRHFKGHAAVSEQMSRVILTRLNYDKLFIDEVCYLIKYHDTPITPDLIRDNYSLAYKLYLVQTCDALAHNPNTLEKRKEYLAKTKKSLDK